MKKEDKDDKIWLYIVIPVAGTIVILIIILIIFYKMHLFCFKKVEKTHDPNYNVNEDLVPEENDVLKI